MHNIICIPLRLQTYCTLYRSASQLLKCGIGKQSLFDIHYKANGFTWKYISDCKRLNCNDFVLCLRRNNLTALITLRTCSRWARISQSSYTINQSRKRQRNKNGHLTEKFKSKLYTAKMRETRRRMADKMTEIKENVLTIPNGLCLLRILATPVIGYLVLQEFYSTSLGLFIFAGCTDVVDGYIARNFPNQQSMIGSFLDPAADKLLIATLFITLTVNGLIPVPLTSLIIFRDACLMSAGFYIRYISLPPPRTLSRYFDMSFVTAKLSPTSISKVNTLIQLSLVAASLAAPIFSFVDHYYLHLLWYVTGTTTVLSAASYLYYKSETYKFFASRRKRHKNL